MIRPKDKLLMKRIIKKYKSRLNKIFVIFFIPVVSLYGVVLFSNENLIFDNDFLKLLFVTSFYGSVTLYNICIGIFVSWIFYMFIVYWPEESRKKALLPEVREEIGNINHRINDFILKSITYLPFNIYDLNREDAIKKLGKIKPKNILIETELDKFEDLLSVLRGIIQSTYKDIDRLQPFYQYIDNEIIKELFIFRNERLVWATFKRMENYNDLSFIYDIKDNIININYVLSYFCKEIKSKNFPSKCRDFDKSLKNISKVLKEYFLRFDNDITVNHNDDIEHPTFTVYTQGRSIIFSFYKEVLLSDPRCVIYFLDYIVKSTGSIKFDKRYHIISKTEIEVD